MYYDAIDLLKGMISRPSFSREEGETADFLKQSWEKAGYKVNRKGNNLWLIAPGFDLDKPTLLLNSHIDTVKPASGWTKDPFNPDIDGEFAAVRNDIVLCPGVDNRDAHFHRSEEIAFFRELIGVEPFDVFHRKRDRIDPLVPGGMSCLAGADTVQDHQPFFGYGRLHAGRFADNGECDRGKVGKSAFQPVLAGNFFFA